VFLDRIVYTPFPNSAVQLANLQSGALDMIERMAPTDAPTVKANPHLRLLPAQGIAYQGLFFNLHHGPLADNPLGRDKRVRQALEKSIDRTVLNQVVLDGQFVPSNQVEAPGTPYWNPAHPVPPRDLAGAKALLKEAGYDKVSVSMIIANSPVAQQTGELIQSMAAEAGFDIKLRVLEANAGYQAAINGDYQITTGIWSGRADPDGNIAIWVASDGFLNWSQYRNATIDDLLVKARSVTDIAQRRPLYFQISDIYLDEMPFMVLYHQNWLFATSDKVSGFTPVPDGLIRPQGMKLN
jgi:peptide/nickel transport system substrate-binding protein